MNSTVGVYARLFDPAYVRGAAFYRALYTTPVQEVPLSAVLSTNSAAVGVSARTLEQNVGVLQELYWHGVELLVEVMGCGGAVPPPALAAAEPPPLPLALRQPHPGSAGSARKGSVLDDDGDLGNGDVGGDALVEGAAAAAAAFGGHSLRAELIANILAILRLWFRNIGVTNAALARAKHVLGFLTSTNLVADLAAGPRRLCEASLARLVRLLQWFLRCQFDSSDATTWAPLGACVDVIYEATRVLLILAADAAAPPAAAALLEALSAADVAPEVDKLVIALAGASPYTLDFRRRVQIYCVAGVLAKVPLGGAGANAGADDDDITALPVRAAAASPAAAYYNHARVFDSADFHAQIAAKTTPLLSMDFKLWYESLPDLLLSTLASTSFVSWLTGNRLGAGGYARVATSTDVTSASNNRAEFELAPKDAAWIDELEGVYTARLQREHDAAAAQPAAAAASPSLLPILLYLHAHSKNSSFYVALVNDGDAAAATGHIDLLDILLCLSSYVFFQQHTLALMRATSHLYLAFLLKLTSAAQVTVEPGDTRTEALVTRMARHPIDEFKWKLCHQRAPIIPTSLALGVKSSTLYVLDTLQVYMRFNMTKRLDVEGYSMAVGAVYQVVRATVGSEAADVRSYCWNELYKTLCNVLLFVKKHDLGAKCRHLVEEIFVVMSWTLTHHHALLLPDGKPVTYHLVYNVLLHQPTVEALAAAVGLQWTLRLLSLQQCLEYLTAQFPRDLQDVGRILDMDYESAEFVELVGGFAPQPAAEATEEFQFAPTFRHIDKQLEDDIELPSDTPTIIEAAMTSLDHIQWR